MGAFFSKRFDPVRDIPDQTGRVAIVTGANTGIGFHTAQQLANHGAKVYVASRTESKALAAIEQMESENKALRGSGRLVWLPLDLSSIKACNAAAERVLSAESRVDVLINNAGELSTSFSLTEDGLSSNFAANHVGHFAFTTALLPVLTSTAKLAGADVRVLNVSAIAHINAPAALKFDSVKDFQDPCAPPSALNTWKAGFARLAIGKLANILFANELQRRWDAEGVPALAISLDPGTVATGGARNFFGPILGWLLSLFTMAPLQGAITSLFGATSPEVKARADLYKGAYLVPYGKIGKPSKKAMDAELAKQLWLTSERVVNEVLQKDVKAVAG